MDKRTLVLQASLNKKLQENDQLKKRMSLLEKEIATLKGMIPKDDDYFDDDIPIGGTD
jgi:peptidoglycan hydrolase CwlO-like protein